MDEGTMNHSFQSHYLVENDENLDAICEQLKKGHDPNFQSHTGMTLLQQAAQSKFDNLKVVKELINVGADVNLANRHGLTPLHYAVLHRKRSVVDELIKSGANINAKSRLKRTALHFAISNYQYNQRNRTSLSRSSERDIWIVAKLLNQENIRINEGDIRGDTPLMWAVLHGQLDTVLLLLEKGANPSIRNKDYVAPLHIALSDLDSNLSILVQLLWNRASLKCVDRNSNTPIDILIQNVIKTGSFKVACTCLKVVALCYSIKKPLKRKLKSITYLWLYLKKCCAEVERMRSDIIAKSVTVFDFTMKRFNKSDFDDPVVQVYKPIVEKLLAGLYRNYFRLIILHIPKSNLFEILEKTVSEYKESILNANDCRKKLFVENCEKFSGVKCYKEMSDAKKCMEISDTKKCMEISDTKKCMEISDTKDEPEINLTEFLLKGFWWLPKYFSNEDIFQLIATFSKVKISDCH